MSGSVTHATEVIDAVERFVWSFPEIEVVARARWRRSTDGRSPHRARRTARQYPRTARLNQLLREILADALERIDDERLDLVTVTAVEVDADLRHALVCYDSLQGAEGDAEVLEALAESRRLQAAIGRQARLKRTPELTFEPDPAVRAGEPASRRCWPRSASGRRGPGRSGRPPTIPADRRPGR